MKKFFIRVLTLMMVFSMFACANKPSETALYTAGTYEATEYGMNGDVVVTAEFSDSKILSVTAIGDNETKGLGDKALEALVVTVVEEQSADVDVVSGATVTSTAMLKALQKCIDQAKGIAVDVDAVTHTTADVIVVGGGAAGMAAAATAVEAGADVIVLEAAGAIGGAAATSMGNVLLIDADVNATLERNDSALDKYAKYDAESFPEPWKTDYLTLMTQIEDYKNNGQEKGLFSSVERILVDHYVAGHGKDLDGKEVYLDYDMIRNSVESNKEVYDWLIEHEMKSSPFNDYAVTPEGRGTGLVNALAKAAEGCDIHVNTRATELIVTDGRVTGVKAISNGKEITYTAKNGVVLATGGYASNGEKVAQYQNIGTGLTANIPSNNPASNQGDGIWMAEAIGAELRDMEFITTRIKGYQSLATTGEAGTLFSAAQLVVNADGVRFADGSNKNAIQNVSGNNQKDGLLVMVGDKKMVDALNASKEGMAEDMINRGLAVQADTLAEAAKLAGIDATTLEATVNVFNGYVTAGNDPEFGRTKFNGTVEEGPYYIAKLQMAAHLTFGGLVIDADSHVLDTNGNVISGLYAAGDVTCGYEGVVHQTGNCLSVVVYTGRVAGTNAANNK